MGSSTRPSRSCVSAVLLAAAVVGAAVLSASTSRVRLILTLVVPWVAAGLSFDDSSTSAATLALLIAGAVYAWAVSLIWPEREEHGRADASPPGARVMLEYGIRLGLAAAIAYWVTRSLELDHVGWAPAACLLVARPEHDFLQSRGIARVLAVITGAAAAAVVVHQRSGSYSLCRLGTSGAHC